MGMPMDVFGLQRMHIDTVLALKKTKGFLGCPLNRETHFQLSSSMPVLKGRGVISAAFFCAGSCANVIKTRKKWTIRSESPSSPTQAELARYDSVRARHRRVRTLAGAP